MKLPLFKKFSNLFVTQSGIQVKQPLPILPKDNFLIRYNATGRVLLNNREISNATYRRLLLIIQYYHPDAWSRFEAHQSIIIYPKLVLD